jgi:Na+-transporting NADH:ubiquinone oxidoreductase subunit B
VKALLNLFEKLRPGFEKGGKFAAFRPVFDAAEHVFFAPSTRTKHSPHVRDPLDIKRFMSMVILALLPVLLTAVYFFGLRVLLIIAVSYVVGGAVEVLFAIIRKEQINEGFLVTGLIFPLILPPTVPLWMVAAGIVFGVVIGKELFGGTGRNLFNPALVGRCFLSLSYPASMAAGWIRPGVGFLGRIFQYVDSSDLQAITSATPLVLAKQGQFTNLSDLFFGSIAGSAGETSALAILLGGLFLLISRVANWRTVVSILSSFTILAAVLHYTRPDTFGPVVWHLFAGGLFFGAFYMATDPVTSPTTNGGKWAYGLLIGTATVLIRNLTGYVEGVTFAILLGNICAPVIDEVVYRHRLRRLRDER